MVTRPKFRQLKQSISSCSRGTGNLVEHGEKKHDTGGLTCTTRSGGEMQSGIALGKFGSSGEEIAKFSKNANSIAKTVGDLFFRFLANFTNANLVCKIVGVAQKTLEDIRR